MLIYQQVALEQEKAERSRLAMSLKGNLGRLRQAGDAEQRLGTDVQDLQEQLAAATSARVHLLAQYDGRTALVAQHCKDLLQVMMGASAS